MPASRLDVTSPRETLRSSEATCYGQVIEYIKDRLFLASYTHPPTESTPFPQPRSHARSPSKKASRSHLSPAPNGAGGKQPFYFSIDDFLLYNAFHADFGPLHIGHLYRFAVLLHQILGDPEHEQKAIVFWSHADSRSRANAACILACYMVLIQSWPPHLALAPISQMDPPLMPFRDAGYAQADYILTVQDIVYGVWKAKEEGICTLKDFNLQEYETFERVDMGDFNWLTPSFVAFASPQHKPIDPIPQSSHEFARLPKTAEEVFETDLPNGFKNVLAHFKTNEVGLVVRLNSELYCPSYFEALGITHLDMIFDDGTCPPLNLVKRFVRLTHEMITIKKKAVAVHCKAGLGRTGCLIGAYLIYRHGFTANEVISFMRFMRPGMVVGPQQHWLHLNQGTFREWHIEDTIKAKLKHQSTPPRALFRPRMASNGQSVTPPNGANKRRALGEIDYNEKGSLGVADENLPAPTPGQPRKTSKLYGERPSIYTESENEPMPQPDTEVISMERHTRGADESEEEYQIRMLTRRPSRTPSSNKSSSKRRAISCTTTTTTKTQWEVAEADEKDRIASAKTPTNRSGNGAGSLSINKRNSASRKCSDSNPNGVRKTSGRVGSAGQVPPATRVKQ